MIGSVGRRMILGIDALIRRVNGISEYSTEPGCVLRMRSAMSDELVEFDDGARVLEGEPIGELHLWSERVPEMPVEGATIRWAATMRRQFMYSLQLLAEYVDGSPDWQNISWFRGRGALEAAPGQPSPVRILERIGFRVRAPTYAGWTSGIVRFWQNLYNWWLMWAFNPTSTRRKRLAHMERVEFWFSRDELMLKWGPSRRAGNGRASSSTVHLPEPAKLT